MQVKDVIKTKCNRVISIAPEASVSDAIARLVQNNIGSLPVVDAEGRLVGIFSERDALRGVHHHGEGFGRMQLAKVMTTDTVTCEMCDDVNGVMGKMTERRIAKVPVLKNDVVVGIISVGDVIKYMYEQVSTENQQLMTYIHGGV
jgi:CBS domain-containing protein